MRLSTLLPLATCLFAALLQTRAHAQWGGTGSPPTPTPGACAHTELVQSVSVPSPYPAITCPCKGKQLDVTGFVLIAGVRVALASDGTQVDKSIPICTGYTLYPAYEKYVEGGTTTVLPSTTAMVFFYAPKCDQSGCSGFLFFSWGKATCNWMPPQPAGAIQSYYMTGDL